MFDGTRQRRAVARVRARARATARQASGASATVARPRRPARAGLRRAGARAARRASPRAAAQPGVETRVRQRVAMQAVVARRTARSRAAVARPPAGAGRAGRAGSRGGLLSALPSASRVSDVPLRRRGAAQWRGQRPAQRRGTPRFGRRAPARVPAARDAAASSASSPAPRRTPRRERLQRMRARRALRARRRAFGIRAMGRAATSSSSATTTEGGRARRCAGPAEVAEVEHVGPPRRTTAGTGRGRLRARSGSPTRRCARAEFGDEAVERDRADRGAGSRRRPCPAGRSP